MDSRKVECQHTKDEVVDRPFVACSLFDQPAYRISLVKDLVTRTLQTDDYEQASNPKWDHVPRREIVVLRLRLVDVCGHASRQTGLL